MRDWDILEDLGLACVVGAVPPIERPLTPQYRPRWGKAIPAPLAAEVSTVCPRC
jgi:hypothetical protein